MPGAFKLDNVHPVKTWLMLARERRGRIKNAIAICVRKILYYFIFLRIGLAMSRDAAASVGARSASRQQPHVVVHHAHLLDQDPVGVQARSLLAPRGRGDRVAVAEAVVGQRLRPG